MQDKIWRGEKSLSTIHLHHMVVLIWYILCYSRVVDVGYIGRICLGVVVMGLGLGGYMEIGFRDVEIRWFDELFEAIWKKKVCGVYSFNG